MEANIPPDFTKNGGLFYGMISTQNAKEAAGCMAVQLIIFKIIKSAFGLKAGLSVLGLVGLPLSLLFLNGIGGKSVFTVLKDWMIYKASARVYTLRLPEKKGKRG